ncbi:MAG: type II toxin-antitoxin system RelE/ParE family toxin [Candidatus Micrarchaeota archaeon]|nr:type II toxin-antitoxin system RelE/ParE family toxin [Candidatus Micrarchaeota archaeon]
MPSFEIQYSAEAASQLEILSKPIARRILDKIEITRNDPYRFFKRLVGRPEYKLRVGDYRIIADIESKSKLILIRSIGHRKNIYERL